MKTTKFIAGMRESMNGVFTTQTAMEFLHARRGYCNLYLSRLVQRKEIVRIRRGTYALPETDKLAIAANMAFPSYITGVSALHFHDLINQDPGIVYVFNSRRSERFSLDAPSGKVDVDLIRVAPSRMFGYYRAPYIYSHVFVAEMEKAMVDMLYMPDVFPISYAYDVITSNSGKVDFKKMVAYAKRMSSGILMKRLGYLLDKCGVDVYGEVSSSISKSRERLRFTINERAFNSKWHALTW